MHSILDEIPAPELERVSANLAREMMERIDDDIRRMLGIPAGMMNSETPARSALELMIMPAFEIEIYRPDPRPIYDLSLLYSGVIVQQTSALLAITATDYDSWPTARVARTNKWTEWQEQQMAGRRIGASKQWLKRCTRERAKRAWNAKRRR